MDTTPEDGNKGNWGYLDAAVIMSSSPIRTPRDFGG
jgi:hypothetical protein